MRNLLRRVGIDRGRWTSSMSGRSGPGRGLLIAGMVAVIAGGCSGAGDTEVGADGVGDGPIAVSCGSVTFEGRSIDLDDYPVFTDDLATFVPANFRAEFELEVEEGQLDLVLHEIERTDSRLHLLGRVPGDGDGSIVSFKEIAFERIDGAWTLDRWGGCRPMVDVEGFGISELHLDPSSEPTASSQTLRLLVTERACASGRVPEGRAVVPIVFESEDAVDILVLVESLQGDADCPANPSFPVDVELDAPLGDRVIHNIAFEPVVALPWPIPQRPAELALVVAGDPPADGTANAFAWTGSGSGTILLSPDGWSDFAGWVQSWSPADEPRTISGFVASCGGGGCEEECEGGACVAPERILGEVCSADYVVTEGFDSTVTITYGEQSCTIEQVLSPIG